MKQHQEKNIMLLCTIIGTITSVASLVYSILKDSFSWFLPALALLMFVLIIIQYVFSQKQKNELNKHITQLNNQVDLYANKIYVYDELFESEHPLYGIINYILKKNKIDSENKVNDTYQLDELCLSVKLVNNIEKDKHNDLLMLWRFNGNNTGDEDLSNIHLRIGGDSSTNFEKLNISATQCNLDNNEICENHNKELLCPSDGSKCQLYDSRKLKYSNIAKFSSTTFHLLEFSLVKPIKVSHMLKMKVSYVWPQCFNPNYDYLLIDPQNFGIGVNKIKITVYCDNTIIKSNSKIQLNEVDYSVYKKNSKGLFEYNENDSSFHFELEQVDPKCIYYAEIFCN